VPAALAGLLPVGRNNERRIVMVEDAMTQGHGVYAMGRTEAERARLSQQDRVFAPHSENLFRQAGIREGMRVADIGCGVGDSTTLLARIVGPVGSVIGVDQDASSLEAAGRTVAEAGLSNVSFQQRTLPGIDLDAEVDALAGRLVLIHLDDPASILAELTRYVRPGGIVTFQDITISRARSVPEVPLMTRLIECCSAGMAQSGADPDFGDRLPAVFRRAGLPHPQAVAISIAGNAHSPIPSYLVQTLRSLAPLIVARGTATAEEVTRDGYLEELIEQARRLEAMLYIQELAAAWARVPSARPNSW
jgi:2-polyprenyl-3-methyl-5-hydroxy-6-metoxy-1,4-benzoquinol methylase